ncbi:hypothetical protein LWI28_005266 [Acer negundo]|uniref:Uncharacterized protein n=1 Tax=Acer negundo TaxID=4023 RepID=A0AAD5J9G7_ACENE|nr:hypothetical protein LWI28_005266 [Acer negundo]
MLGSFECKWKMLGKLSFGVWLKAIVPGRWNVKRIDEDQVMGHDPIVAFNGNNKMSVFVLRANRLLQRGLKLSIDGSWAIERWAQDSRRAVFGEVNSVTDCSNGSEVLLAIDHDGFLHDHNRCIESHILVDSISLQNMLEMVDELVMNPSLKQQSASSLNLTWSPFERREVHQLKNQATNKSQM